MCVCGVAEYPATKPFFVSRGMPGTYAVGIQRRRRIGPVISRLITSTYLCISCDSKSFWPPLVAALFVLLVLSGNVFAARRKPSECKPNLHPLETHQLYSRLISTQTISILPWELKCDHPILGEPRVYPLCDPGPVRRKI